MNATEGCIKYYKGQHSDKQLATNKAICHKAKNKSLKVHITLIIFITAEDITLDTLLAKL
jgi:hypothetical protein